MRVIFFDVDGVLNNGNTKIVRRPLADDRQRTEAVPGYHPDCVERFNRLVRQTGAKVVISATWGRRFSLDTLRQHLEQEGVCCETIGLTPVRPTYRPRGYDIDEWIRRWEGESVDTFCILDDHEDMMHLKRYLVRTDYHEGMQERHVHAALTLLLQQ